MYILHVCLADTKPIINKLYDNTLTSKIYLYVFYVSLYALLFRMTCDWYMIFRTFIWKKARCFRRRDIYMKICLYCLLGKARINEPYRCLKIENFTLYSILYRILDMMRVGKEIAEQRTLQLFNKHSVYIVLVLKHKYIVKHKELNSAQWHKLLRFSNEIMCS